LPRKSDFRETRKVFLIVSEGKSEESYFAHYRNRRFSLKTPSCNFTDPENLVKYTRKQMIENGFDKGDKACCVFDVDESTDEQIEKAKRLAGSDIDIILSNPCFELWLLLHFIFIDCCLSKEDTLLKIRNYISGYEHGQDVFDLILKQRERAIGNAIKLNTKHAEEGIELISIASNPSTQVFNVVQDLLQFE